MRLIAAALVLSLAPLAAKAQAVQDRYGPPSTANVQPQTGSGGGVLSWNGKTPQAALDAQAAAPKGLWVQMLAEQTAAKTPPPAAKSPAPAASLTLSGPLAQGPGTAASAATQDAAEAQDLAERRERERLQAQAQSPARKPL